ncbi:MAG TPA: M67 family metallopeptidase [Clostridia bacterium]|nr:M67 family metallopeptidase [Clostridia bacterium]
MLVIGKAEYEDIRCHGEERYPHECCGVLLGAISGNRKIVSRVVRCTNTRGQAARTRYNIDPRELIDIQRQAREHGESILGFYHSHPDAPPHWSRTDLDQAYWPDCSYIIVSVLAGNASEMTSFVLEGADADRRFLTELLEVVEHDRRERSAIIDYNQ